jgi:large subunit ribosomal protein L25
LAYQQVQEEQISSSFLIFALVGKPIGITEGGILSQALNQIEISCFPTNVPEQIEVNIDVMELNSSISIADVSYGDEEVDIISAEDINVASITAPAAEEEITEADADDSADDSEDGGEKDEKSEDSSDQEKSSE